MLGYLYYDMMIIIFGYLTHAEVKRCSMVCKKVFDLYKQYTTKQLSIKAGKTNLFKHQLDMIEWIVKNMIAKKGIRLICQAYMSAGKTLVGYESCIRLLDIYDFKSYALIIVAPNVINVWRDEAKKHFPKNKQIMFYISGLVDKKYIDECDSLKTDLDGKIVVSTPNRVSDKLVKNARFIVIDEGHKYKETLEVINDASKNNSIVYMSASNMALCGINIDDKLIIEKQAVFPRLKSEIIVSEEWENTVTKDILAREDKYIAVLTPNKNSKNFKVAGKLSYDYYQRQVTHYKKFKEEGGILLSTIRSVSEGQNFNNVSCVYIIYPDKCVLNTLRQTVGRFYRQSNCNSDIKIIYILQQKNSIQWARCVLSTIVSLDMTNFEVRDNAHRIAQIKEYLKEKGYEFDKIPDIELVCLFCNNSKSDECTNIVPKYITAKDFIRCMLF